MPRHCAFAFSTHSTRRLSRGVRQRLRGRNGKCIVRCQLSGVYGRVRPQEIRVTPFPASQSPWQSTQQEDNTCDSDSSSGGGHTQLVFNLYNRGSGWGEEIIPHITVEKRTVVKKQRVSWQVRTWTCHVGSLTDANQKERNQLRQATRASAVHAGENCALRLAASLQRDGHRASFRLQSKQPINAILL
jgi:hypothetical protein